MAGTVGNNAYSALSQFEPPNKEKGPSKQALYRRRKNAARKAPNAAKDPAAVLISPPSSQESHSQDEGNPNHAKDGAPVTEPKDLNVALAETRGTEPVAKPPKSAIIVAQQLSNAGSRHAPDELDVGFKPAESSKKGRRPKGNSGADGEDQSSISILEKNELNATHKADVFVREEESKKSVVDDANTKSHTASDNATAESSQPTSSPVAAYLSPTTSKSWASVCSLSHTEHTLPAFLAPEVFATTERSVRSTQGSSIYVESSRMTSSPSNPTSIVELNEFIHRPGSWANIATNIPSSKIQDVPLSSLTHEQQSLPTDADFPAALPSSPQQDYESSAVSYAEVIQSRPSRPPTPSSTNRDVPPQPKTPSEPPSIASASVVVKQPLDNLYVMIRPERQNLFNGPLITIMIGSIRVTGIFKRVAMALSSVLNDYFVRNPESVEYDYPEDILVPGAVRYLLITYPQVMRQEFMAYAVPMQETFAKNVSLLHASRKLGMTQYTKHILTNYIGYLKEQLPSYEEIAIVEHMATSDKDPLFTHMVNHLCHDRFQDLIPDSEDFEAFLTHHPRLREAMRIADIYFAGVAKKRWEQKQAQWQAAEDERRMHWEQTQMEKRERIAKEKAAVESVKEKMDAKGGSGLMMVTAEEAAFLRNH